MLKKIRLLYYQLTDQIEYLRRHFVKPENVLKHVFKERMGYELNLETPQTFNEKLQWLKLYNHDPLYTTMVDKYAVKQYVAEKIGKEYVIPTLGVWNRFDDIDFNKLPNQFVLKCTHDSGGLVICKDKSKLNVKKASQIINKSLSRNFYYAGFEWPYKNVKPRIIAEQFMEDETGELKDYKVFNFNGEPRIIEVDYNRFKGHLRNLYNTEWERIDAIIEYPTDPSRNISKPEVLNHLLELSRKLSLGIPFLRTDFYIVDNKVFFGELTFFHGCGFENIQPKSFDKQMGDWIVLPIRA